MALYLSMDGVDDTLVSYLTFTEIKIDMAPNNTGNDFGYYIGAGSSSFSKLYADDTWNGFSSVYKNDVLQTKGTPVVTNNVRATYRILSAAPLTTNVFIFNNNFYDLMKGKIYDIKFYNGATLVAWYDMTKGNVLDQSGNGKNATLSGGTWLDDGVGGGNAYTKSLSDSVATSETFTKRVSRFKTVTDSVTSSDSSYKKFTATVIDTVSAGDSESESTNKKLNDAITSADSIASTRGKAVNLSDTIAITETIRKALSKFQSDSINGTDMDSESVSKKLTDAISQTDSITVFGGKSVVLSDNISLTDSIKKAISQAKSDGITVTETFGKQSKQSVKVYDVIVSTDQVDTFLPNVPVYAEVIRLTLNISETQSVNIAITQRDEFKLDVMQRKRIDLEI